MCLSFKRKSVSPFLSFSSSCRLIWPTPRTGPPPPPQPPPHQTPDPTRVESPGDFSVLLALFAFLFLFRREISAMEWSASISSAHDENEDNKSQPMKSNKRKSQSTSTSIPMQFVQLLLLLLLQEKKVRHFPFLRRPTREKRLKLKPNSFFVSLSDKRNKKCQKKREPEGNESDRIRWPAVKLDG